MKKEESNENVIMVAKPKKVFNHVRSSKVFPEPGKISCMASVIVVGVKKLSSTSSTKHTVVSEEPINLPLLGKCILVMASKR